MVLITSPRWHYLLMFLVSTLLCRFSGVIFSLYYHLLCNIHRAFLHIEASCLLGFADCYDPLDPSGNVTITFDILKYTLDGYVARITIQNYYQYRHIEEPGWSLGWLWTRDEVIWSMSGAFAIQQGNCSTFKFEVPHSCKKDPAIVDLPPDASPQNRSNGCCHGGILAAYAVRPSLSNTSFEITVGNLEPNAPGYKPTNLTLITPRPGYTCDQLMDTTPTVSSVIGGRREEQVFRTWKSTCTYSSYLADKMPVCCVSLSSFYSPKVTSCPSCSCGCKVADHPKSCTRDGSISSISPDVDMVQCTDHMCPLRVHWHIKNTYMDHWRVKLTVSNYNYGKNYSDWNVLVQHPGLRQPATAYSFNSTSLPMISVPEEVALFWGKPFYNSELLQSDKDQLGSVTTEILLKKDSKSFTLSNGWGFPRTIYFNGENCKMPLPDSFPMLPNGSSGNQSQFPFHVLVVYLTYEIFVGF